jgi:hypothetical protein
LPLTSDHIQYIYGDKDVYTVRPQDSISRGEVVSILYRLLMDASKTVQVDSPFPDVPLPETDLYWFSHEIAYMSSQGYVNGYEDGTFRPFDPMTRAEFATVIAKYYEYGDSGTDRFNDIADHWARQYINVAAEKGWVSGYPDGSFQPENHLTRAEVVTIINRMTGRGIKLEDITSDAPTFVDITPAHWAYCDIMEAAYKTHYFDRLDDGYEKWAGIVPNGIGFQTVAGSAGKDSSGSAR